ncbi:membrane-associated protein, putative [Bodo saltans]|uniref:Membrane-associated protein, putative n=1 Tax=Bodo saltans TaxID=75058 RepID=A0A0S4J0E7_BODSA|nr:membrane-associated protein, putative [Bodo saltans]|eukprot:CUG44258.1 membrane-associated protein, putative [Bodo saltans]
MSDRGRQPATESNMRHTLVIVLIVVGASLVLWGPLMPTRRGMTLDEALGIFGDVANDTPQQQRLRESLTDGNLQYVSTHYQRLAMPRQHSSDGLLIVPTLNRMMVSGNVRNVVDLSRWSDIASLEMHIDHNETFVALPIPVPGCTVIRHRKSNFPGNLQKAQDVTFWVRVTHDGLLDPDAFVTVGDDVLMSLCPDIQGRRTVSVPQLNEVNLRAVHPDDIECQAKSIASVKTTLGLPRMAMHVALYWSSKKKLLKKAKYIQRMVANAQGFPFHVDLYLHANTGVDPGIDDGVALLRTDPLFTIEEMWAEQNLGDKSGVQNVVASQDTQDGSAAAAEAAVSVKPLAAPSLEAPPLASEEEEDKPSGEKAGSLLMSTEYLTQYILKEVAGVKSSRPAPNLRIFVVSHTLKRMPLMFPFKARQLIQHHYKLYDLMLFTEDDIDIEPINLDYYCRFKNEARRQQHYLAYFRYEFGKGKRRNPTGKVLSDVLRTQKISRNSTSLRIKGQLFAQVEIQVYHAFWLADRQDMHELVKDRRFLRKDFALKALVLEEASCLHGPIMMTHVYKQTKIFPVDPSTNLLHPMCLVHHMSNAYGDKGMAYFHDAGRVVFCKNSSAACHFDARAWR